MITEDLLSILVCPIDRSPLKLRSGSLVCGTQSHQYRRGEHGFLEVAEPTSPVMEMQSTSPDCAHVQEICGERVYTEFLRPWLSSQNAVRILDAGCGLGVGVAAASADGYQALGVDMRALVPFWRAAERSADDFVVADVVRLPFKNDAFDAAMTLGVIEHVGTMTGHVTLADGWRAQRETFARELFRVVKPGGRILIACPSKWFPIDIQHGPTDELTQAPFRARIFQRFGVNLHQTWGAYHLASYSDLYRWFGRERVRPLPLKGYFGFSALDRDGVPKWAGLAARGWVDNLPWFLRATPFNPYLLAEIRVS